MTKTELVPPNKTKLTTNDVHRITDKEISANSANNL